MSDQDTTGKVDGKIKYSVFKCKKCGCDKVIVMNIDGMPSTTVVCGEFKADGSGCQTQFHELQVKFVPVKQKESPQGATKVPVDNPMKQQ